MNNTIIIIMIIIMIIRARSPSACGARSTGTSPSTAPGRPGRGPPDR